MNHRPRSSWPKLVGKLIVNYLNAAISVFCAGGMCEARAAITLVAIVCLYSLLLHKSFTTIQQQKKKNLKWGKKLLPLSPLFRLQLQLVLVQLDAVCNLSFTPRAWLRAAAGRTTAVCSCTAPHPLGLLAHFSTIFSEPTFLSPSIRLTHPAFLMAANTRVRRDHFHNAALCCHQHLQLGLVAR